MNNELLAYAIDFVSFVVDSLEDKNLRNIKEIILFGSVSRGTSDKDSDIDLFVNVIKEGEMEGKIEKLKKDFYTTEIFKRWSLRGIDNEIKIIVDRLDKWKDIKVSIISDGIILYSKYKGTSKGSQYVIIYWNKIKSESKRVFLSKKLYGYSSKKSNYKGLVELTGSEKLGSNCIMADLATSKKILDVFRDLNITVKSIYVNKI